MKLNPITIPIAQLAPTLEKAMHHGSHRLGTLTSIDGDQIVVLMLSPAESTASLFITELSGDEYKSITSFMPAAHWFERSLKDFFGITAVGHPRLKSAMATAILAGPPLREEKSTKSVATVSDADSSYMHARGQAVYEVAVGPVHAGIIEPGHFRFNCLGESILNLEIRLGYLHRGVEKRLAETPFHQGHFVAESASSDTAVANALCNSIAIESLLDVEVSEKANYLRTIALEIERVAMHIGDVGGMAVDLGYLTIAASLSRLRGLALRLGEYLAGSRFMRGYIIPGGVRRDLDRKNRDEMLNTLKHLVEQLKPIFETFTTNAAVYDRTTDVGKVSKHLAGDFGLVGVAARASGLAYDVRNHFAHGLYPLHAPGTVTERNGDVRDRVLVRIKETALSLELIEKLLKSLPAEQSLNALSCCLPDSLPANSAALGIVEAFRGELLHLIFTDEAGKIKRYHIKDPSANNWTGLAIAARNNLLSDFPICNKSFSLSYSGHDL